MANTIGNNLEQIDPSAETTRTEWDDLAGEVPFRDDNEAPTGDAAENAPAEATSEDSLASEEPATEGEASPAAPAESKKLLADMFRDSGEARPARLSEAERRRREDREGVDSSLRMLVSALNEEGLRPDDERKINLSLDVMDEVSAMLDDEDNDLGAHDILQKLAQRYDKLSQKAPSRERKLKYVAMAVYAQSQLGQFGDWRAMDAKKSQSQTTAEKTFGDLSELM